MKTFGSAIDIFERDYKDTEAAEITTSDHNVYFTVIHRKDSEDIEIYDMKNNRKFLVEGTFLGVCTLLGLSLDPMELDPISITDDSINPVDADVIGSYYVTVKNGKWVDYDFDDDDSQALVESELKTIWDSYNQAPDMIAIYNR